MRPDRTALFRLRPRVHSGGIERHATHLLPPAVAQTVRTRSGNHARRAGDAQRRRAAALVPTTRKLLLGAILAAAGALLLTAASPLAAQTGPAKFIPTFLVYYGHPQDPPLVAAETQRLAKFDLIDTDRFHYDDIDSNTWAAIKSNNPNVQIFLYEMGTEVSNGSDATAQLNLSELGRYDVSRGHSMGNLSGDHPELFLRDPTGKRIHSVAFSDVGANLFSYLMDFGSAVYQSYWLEAVKTDIVNHPWVADGVYADNCLTLPSAGRYSGTSAWYSTNAAWSAAMNSFAGAITAGLHGVGQKLWCNLGSTTAADGAAAWLMLDTGPNPPDIMMEEGAFAVSWDSQATSFYIEEDWKRQVDVMGAIRNSKIAMLSHTQLTEGQAGTDNFGKPVTYWQTLWYSLGSFLLGKNQQLNNAYFMFTQGGPYNKIPWHDEYDKIDLGKAVGPYIATSFGGVNIYSREFEKGYVYVNPTPSDAASVTLPQMCRQITHENLLSPSSRPLLKTIALPSHHATILEKTVITIGPAATAFARLAKATGNAIHQAATATAGAQAGGASPAPGAANSTTMKPSAAESTARTGDGWLTGSGVAGSTIVDLTAVGAVDWVTWPGPVRKATGEGQLNTNVAAGTVTVQTYTGDPRTLAWTDGTPSASGSNRTGLYVSGIGAGFQIIAPADTTNRTLDLYVGGFNSGATLSARLSDDSATDYLASEPAVPGAYGRVYTLTYRAASPGQQLTVTWTQTSGGGNVRLQGAALK